MELHDIQRLWDSAALGFNTGCSRPDMANGLEDGYLLLANVHCQVLVSLVDAALVGLQSPCICDQAGCWLELELESLPLVETQPW